MPARVPAATAFAIAALAAAAAATAAAAGVSPVVSPGPLTAPSSKRVLVVLGDDSSDIGNTYKLTEHTVPPPPYAEGRYSNGILWPEVAATWLGLELDCGAYAGSTTDNNRVKGTAHFSFPANEELMDWELDFSPPDLYRQADKTFRDGSQKDVLAVFAGANDFAFNPDAVSHFSAGRVFAGANNFASNPEILARLSARRVVHAVFRIPQFVDGKLPTLVFELPPLEMFPYFNIHQDEELREAARKWTLDFNDQLHAEVDAVWRGERGEGFSPIDVFPTYSTFYEILPTFYFTGRPCFNGQEIAGDPSLFAFWDQFHFTEDFHLELGTFVAHHLQALMRFADILDHPFDEPAPNWSPDDAVERF